MCHLSPFPATPRIKSSLDGASRGRIHGWAVDCAAPFRRLTIDVEMLSGKRFAVLADRYRADVHQHGLGDGYCGFSIPLNCLDENGAIRIVCNDPPFVLGTLDVSNQTPPALPPRTFRRDNYVLAVDQPIGWQISGWVASKVHPTSRRLLGLRRNGRIVAQQRATLFREAAAKFAPDGYHGFCFSIPADAAEEIVLEDVETGAAFALRP